MPMAWNEGSHAFMPSSNDHIHSGNGFHDYNNGSPRVGYNSPRSSFRGASESISPASSAPSHHLQITKHTPFSSATSSAGQITPPGSQPGDPCENTPRQNPAHQGPSRKQVSSSSMPARKGISNNVQFWRDRYFEAERRHQEDLETLLAEIVEEREQWETERHGLEGRIRDAERQPGNRNDSGVKFPSGSQRLSSSSASTSPQQYRPVVYPDLSTMTRATEMLRTFSVVNSDQSAGFAYPSEDSPRSPPTTRADNTVRPWAQVAQSPGLAGISEDGPPPRDHVQPRMYDGYVDDIREDDGDREISSPKCLPNQGDQGPEIIDELTKRLAEVQQNPEDHPPIAMQRDIGQRESTSELEEGVGHGHGEGAADVPLRVKRSMNFGQPLLSFNRGARRSE